MMAQKWNVSALEPAQFYSHVVCNQWTLSLDIPVPPTSSSTPEFHMYINKVLSHSGLAVISRQEPGDGGCDVTFWQVSEDSTVPIITELSV